MAVDGRFDPAWEAVRLTFRDRPMAGSDTRVDGQWESDTSIMAARRHRLSKRSEAAARKIAYRNAERLFGREVSMGLAGAW